MKSTKERIQDYIIITIGTIIASFSVFFFLTPSHLAVGSISGLAVLIAKFVPMTVGTLLIILNGICLLLSAIFVGKEFTYRTLYPSILLPIVIRILEKIYPNMQSLMGDQFLDMLGYLFLYALGASLLFMNNASSGGLDVITKIMNKYFHMELGKAMALPGMCVALSSVFFSDKKLVVLGILGTYLNGIVLDHFIFGLNQKKRVCIISEKEEEIRQFILHTLHSGATIYQGFGAFDNEPKTEIITIVDKNEYAQLMPYILKTDPKAFVTVYAVNEIIYRPKR